MPLAVARRAVDTLEAVARLILLASGLVMLIAPMRDQDGFRARTLSVYWWILLGLAVRGATYVSDLVFPIPGGNTGALLPFIPMLAVGVFMLYASLSRHGGYVDFAGGCLTAFGVLSIGWVIGGSGRVMPLLAFFSLFPAISRASNLDIRAYKHAFVHAGRWMGGTLVVVDLLRSGALLGQCRTDKCSSFGVQVGETGSGNAVGIAVVIIGVLAAWGIARRAVLPYLAAVYFLADLSSSRSAVVIFWFAVPAVLIAIYLPARYAKWLLAAEIAALVSGMLYIARFGTWTTGAYTGRGALWNYARALIHAHPWFGLGPSFWVRQSATDELNPNYSAHNLMLELLVGAGYVGLLLVIAAVAAAIRTRTAVSTPILGVTVVLWLAGGLTEVVAAPGRLYLMPLVFMLIFVLARARSPEEVAVTDDDADAAGDTRDRSMFPVRVGASS